MDTCTRVRTGQGICGFSRALATISGVEQSELGEGASLERDREEAHFRIERAYELAWHAVQLARTYEAEAAREASERDPNQGRSIDRRVIACVERIRELRSFVRAGRMALRTMPSSGSSEVRPGLRKAEANDPRHPRQTEQTYEIRFTKKLSYKS